MCVCVIPMNVCNVSDDALSVVKPSQTPDARTARTIKVLAAQVTKNPFQ